MADTKHYPTPGLLHIQFPLPKSLLSPFRPLLNVTSTEQLSLAMCSNSTSHLP